MIIIAQMLMIGTYSSGHYLNYRAVIIKCICCGRELNTLNFKHFYYKYTTHAKYI